MIRFALTGGFFDTMASSLCRRGRRCAKGSGSWIRGLGWVLFATIAPSVGLSQSKPHATAGSQVASSLGPGDFILVKIWREPDLSDSIQVDNAGVAVFPKLGPIKVTGIRADSLERLLVTRYGQYLQNPSVRVTVLRRITIWGAVMRPGTYPVDLTMTITDALALAGGATPQGKTDKVELRRGSDRSVINLSGKIRQVPDLPLRSGDQLYVPQRSWMSRNAALVITGVAAVTSLAWLITQN